MNHNWRNILQRPAALLLALLLVISMVPLQALSVEDAASKKEDRLILNGSFDADLSGWKAAPVDHYTGDLFWEDGAAILKTLDAFGMENEVLIPVKPTGTYRLSYQAVLDEGAELSAYIYYYTADGVCSDMPFRRLHITAEAEKTDFNDQFTVPADAHQVSVRFVLHSTVGAEVTAKVDNVELLCLQESNPAQQKPVTMTAYDAIDQILLKNMRDTAKAPAFQLNVNFEDGEELPWTLWSGSKVENGILTQSADSNGYAEGAQKYAVTAGKTYVISAKIKATGRSQAVYWLYEYNAKRWL